MTDCNKIYEIINNPDIENLKVELKSFNVLNSNPSRKKFLHEIVAIANKQGGQILLGVNNNGSFEGLKLPDPDKIKGTINNLIFDKISPIIACEIVFINCKEGDVFLINIPKKNEIPYAYVRKSNDEIITREYLIRTSHGVRHVSNRQLQFLFKEEEINFNYPFQVVINYNQEKLQIPLKLKQPPAIQRSYADFLNNLPETDSESLLSNSNLLIDFFLEVTPFILLINLSHHFFLSWIIKCYDNQYTSSEMPLTIPTQRITYDLLPEVSKDSVISSLSINFKDYLSRHGFQNFFIPPNTNISIDTDKTFRSSKVKFENEDFSVLLGYQKDVKYASLIPFSI